MTATPRPAVATGVDVAVRAPDPLVRVADRPAAELVAAAFLDAADAADAIAERSDESLFHDPHGHHENADTDVWTEAWLRVDRAQILGRLAVAPPAVAAPVSVEQRRLAAEGRVPPGELHLDVPGTGETYALRLYDRLGRMRPDAVVEASWALRDRRNDRARTITPRLLAMLYIVGQYYDAPLEVISAYRIRGVNASSGSRHGAGSACDFRVDGVGTRTLARYVDATFEHVGVGYYPTSRFVHLDTRERTYRWTDRSGPGERSRLRSRDARTEAQPGSDPTVLTPNLSEADLYVPPPYREED